MYMNYELAKKLKNAGFPQGTTSSDILYTYLDSKGNPCSSFIEGSAYVPTLSELIEACGDEFDYVRNCATRGNTLNWIALSKEKEGEVDSARKAVGDTPEEAVANLWLVLNEKKDA